MLVPRRIGRVCLPLLMVTLASALLLSAGTSLEASVVYSQVSGDTTQPVDDPRWNSTVQWQTVNGGGTVIGPHTFLSADHLPAGNGDQVKLTTVTSGPVMNTTTYTTTAHYNVPGTDLTVWTVSGTFPAASIRPLYTGAAGSEAGQPISILGYGYHVQGANITTTVGMSTVQNGWTYSGGHGDPTNGGVLNFGTNTVAFLSNDGVSGSPTLDFPFQQLGGDQAMIASGDSGGGVYINVGGTEYLAGVNYAVLTLFSAPNAGSAINGAIYDATGLYVPTGPSSWDLASNQGITTQYGFASEIAPYVAQIEAKIVPEPATAVLLGLGAIALFFVRRRRMRKS